MKTGGYIHSAVDPTPRDPSWLARHEDFCAQARSGKIDLLFLGDSLTDWWRDPDRGGPVWDGHFARLRAANFGISADRTQHVLWRLRHGEADGYAPENAVLLIGTNNTGMENDGSVPRNTPAETIEGIKAVVAELRRCFPVAKLLVFALFPRGEKDSLHRRQITQINAALTGIGDDDRNIILRDIGECFLHADGEIREELMPDRLHLSTAGYRLWAEAIDAACPELLA